MIAIMFDYNAQVPFKIQENKRLSAFQQLGVDFLIGKGLFDSPVHMTNDIS